MKFELVIEVLGDGLMRSRTDVAYALEALAKRLRQNNQVKDGHILDFGDPPRVVGVWRIENDEDSGVYDPREVEKALSMRRKK